MRRTTALAAAMAMLLWATPAFAADEAATDEADTQRTQVPELGISMEFPADWQVIMPEGERESAISTADGEPILETTVLYANAGGGTWCDVDAYLDMAPDAELEAFAFSFVTYVQENENADAAMFVEEAELPVGPGYRVEVFDPTSGRIRGMYLFDGPAREDGTFERYLLTCASREVGEPFWATIAESTEFSEPTATEEDTDAEETEADEVETSEETETEG